MPILVFSENGRPSAALFMSLPQASQYATILPAFNSSTYLFSSNILSIIASRQLASQAIIFSTHETGIIITFPPRCAMSTMTLSLLKISSGILCPGAPKGARPRGARMHSWPGHEIVFVRCMLIKGRNSVWQMGEYVFLWRLPS